MSCPVQQADQMRDINESRLVTCDYCGNDVGDNPTEISIGVWECEDCTELYSRPEDKSINQIKAVCEGI